MAISSVVLRGYGNGTVTGDIGEVVTRGYTPGVGGPVAPPDTSSPGGSPGRIISSRPTRKKKKSKRTPEKTSVTKPVTKLDIIPRPGTTVDIPQPELPPEGDPLQSVENLQKAKQEILTFEEMPLETEPPGLPPEKKASVEQIQETKEEILTFDQKPLKLQPPVVPHRPELGLDDFKAFTTAEQQELILKLFDQIKGLQEQIERFAVIAGEQSTMMQILQTKLDFMEKEHESMLILWMIDNG